MDRWPGPGEPRVSAVDDPVMRLRAATVMDAATLAVLFAAATAEANFTSSTGNQGSSFSADVLAPPTGLTAACGETAAGFVVDSESQITATAPAGAQGRSMSR